MKPTIEEMTKLAATGRPLFLLLVILAGALLMSILSGCGGELETALPEGGKEVPLQVKSNIDLEVTTRATPTSTPLTSGSIGVYRYNDNGYAGQYNMKYTYSDSVNQWLPADNDNTIYVGANEATLLAYYPYNSLEVVQYKFQLDLTAKKYEVIRDVQYATKVTNVTNLNPTANFTMEHAYARIKLSITRDASYQGSNCEIKTVNIKSDDNRFMTQQKMYLLDGRYVENSQVYQADGWTYTFNPSITIAQGTTNSDYDVLVPEQSLKNNQLIITINIDDQDCSAIVNITTGALQKGKLYTVRLKVTNFSLTISGGVTVEDYVTEGNVITNDPVIIK